MVGVLTAGERVLVQVQDLARAAIALRMRENLPTGVAQLSRDVAQLVR